MKIDGRKRVVIENISPVVNNGEFPAKRIVGEEAVISACIFADGHDEIRAAVAVQNTPHLLPGPSREHHGAAFGHPLVPGPSVTFDIPEQVPDGIVIQ